MSRNWDRREFVRLAAGTLAGVTAASVLGCDARPGESAPAGESAGGATAPGPSLPPRTVGLRTLGGDFRFDPPGLRVASGDTLTWLNVGDFHTTTAFHPDNTDLLPMDVPLRIPRGAESWHSGMLGLSAGTQFDYTFRVPGVYDYFCQPHYSFGMVGRVVADEPKGGPATSRPAGELNEASRKMMPPVETLMGPAGRTYEWASRLNGLLLLRSRDEPAGDAATALAGAAREDDGLQEVLSSTGETSRFRERLDAVTEAAGDGGVGYQTLLDRIDAAKEPLTTARRRAGS